MRNRYGRSLSETDPRKTITIIKSQNISISTSGILNLKIYETAFNTEWCIRFVNNLLTHLQKANMLNNYLLLDNAPIHKNHEIPNLGEINGYSLYFLPPYSPQLNPIGRIPSAWKGKIKSENCPSKNI